VGGKGKELRERGEQDSSERVKNFSRLEMDGRDVYHRNKKFVIEVILVVLDI